MLAYLESGGKGRPQAGDRLSGAGRRVLVLSVSAVLLRLAGKVQNPWGTLPEKGLGGWLGLSWLYALYVERIADYSLLYGSIGAVMVLMIWLYMTANVLILGAELNGALAGLGLDREPGLQLGEN